MRYQPTIYTSDPQKLTGLQPGQWINADGSIGRYMGWKNQTIWIAWSGTARKRFHAFAKAYKAT